MKNYILKLTSVVCLIAVFLSISCTAFADKGINNVIIGQEDSTSKSVESNSAKEDLQLIMNTGDGNTITLPDPADYYEEPVVMYVNAPQKNSIYAYKLPKADKNKLMNYPYHGIRVLSVAEQGDFTCIIYYDNKNNDHAAWVESKDLTNNYPGREQTIGTPCVSYAYNIGDTPVSWSKEKFVGSGQRYTILNETAYGCVQLTLDYQVIGRGEAKSPEDVCGPRTVYVNDGDGWILVGQFEYSKIDADHVVINLPEPMDIMAIATVASCAMPDTFIFRQSVLDVMTQ